MNGSLYNDTEHLFQIFADLKGAKILEEKDENFILHYHRNLVKNLQIKLDKGCDLSYIEEDFLNIAEEALPHLKSLLRFFEEIIKVSETCLLKPDTYKALALDSIIVSQYLNENHYWSNKQCSAIANSIIESSLILFHCENISDYYFSKENTNPIYKKSFPNGILKILLEEFLNEFNKNTWKKYPSYKDTYSWMLFNVKSPHLSDYIVYFLPPALFILDDWEQENKVFGIKALQHIIENTPSSELRWYGRATVILEALKHNLYTREPMVLECAYPTAILAATVLEKCPQAAKSMQKKFYDTLMERLLSEMNFEQMLQLRTIYANALKIMVQEMKIFAVKWCDLILEVCTNYLETYEGEEAQDRIYILEVRFLGLLFDICCSYQASKRDISSNPGVQIGKVSNAYMSPMDYGIAFITDPIQNEGLCIATGAFRSSPKTLEYLIRSCWPRIKQSRHEQILKMVIQVAYEANLEDSPVKNKDKLLEKTKSVCRTLYSSSPQTTRELCRELEDLNINYKNDILFVINDCLN